MSTSNRFLASALTLATSLCASQLALSATPDWMRAQVAAPLPAHDATTVAILMYSETVLTVRPNGTMVRLERAAYKILRPAGEDYGNLRVSYDTQTRITSLRAWSIPATGKDYELKEKDAAETALDGVQNGELITDLRTKVLRIPAATPGSIVGYEVEREERPYMHVQEWDFQDTIPVREVRFSLQLPAGWTFKTTWLNYPEQSPVSADGGKNQWAMTNLKPIRIEDAMPPWPGIAGRMSVALMPPTDQASGMQSWNDIGRWYDGLTKDRRDSSPQIKKQVAEATASASTALEKIQKLSSFVQSNIRYVAIELGIGGHQPHRAIDVFANRFGDCKDKATLLNVMLKEIGVESYYVIINTERGSVVAATPPSLGFNHVILAIALPADADDPSLLASATHPKVGKLLYFDPTDTMTPFGRLSGALQSNYGLLVTRDGGELLPLPRLPLNSNTINRSAYMTLDATGTLRGDIQEARTGELAAIQRELVRTATQETDRIKPVESVVAASFTSFEIQKAAMGNFRAADKPFEWHYTVIAPNYAKVAGDLLLVRPRLLGSKSSGLLETVDPREHAIEFDGPQLDRDEFEITLPQGYEVEELPPPVNVDEGFAAYRSKTEVVDGKIRYSRTFEIKELSVPANKAEKLKRLYRTIENDERMLAVLKRAGHK